MDTITWIQDIWWSLLVLLQCYDVYFLCCFLKILILIHKIILYITGNSVWWIQYVTCIYTKLCEMLSIIQLNTLFYFFLTLRQACIWWDNFDAETLEILQERKLNGLLTCTCIILIRVIKVCSALQPNHTNPTPSNL